MDNPSNQPLPHLALSNEQLQVLSAHSANAVAQMISTQFSGQPKEDQLSIYKFIYQQGRLHAYENLKNYDTETLAAAQQEQSNA